MSNLTKKLMSLLAVRFIHKRIKKKAIDKAVNKVREEEVIGDKFYVLINNKKLDIINPHISKQDFEALIERIKSTIKAFNGKKLIHMNTSIGTMIFFNIPQSSVLSLHKDLKKFDPNIQVGRAKNN